MFTAVLKNIYLFLIFHDFCRITLETPGFSREPLTIQLFLISLRQYVPHSYSIVMKQKQIFALLVFYRFLYLTFIGSLGSGGN